MTGHSEPTSRTRIFLFADLEGSTRLWEQFPQAMKSALERHDALLRGAVESWSGRVTKTTGDGLSAVFDSALDALSASLEAQRGLLNEPWRETGPLRVRMGLHVGEAQPRGGDYYGPAVNRAARLMSAAHGGQVLLSAAAASLVADLLPGGASLRDLGQHRLKDLERPEHIFQLVHPDLPADFPPLATLDRRPNNLPAQPTALIGREAELGEIAMRLNSDGPRLLTLTGPGGIGKTRIALQAAADLIDRFEDGVYFVDLAPIRDPASVLASVAQAVGLREASDRPLLDDLTGLLRRKTMLLLIDNFEQVTGAAPQLAELLRECPQLKMLVTSREALRVRGEQIYPVPPLALPQADMKQMSVEQVTQSEAVRLFVERAQAVKPDFILTDENAAVVAEICTRLDGLPLAIELAAAWIRLFSPQDLLERLGSRLDLLQGGARDLPARQQALRKTMEWSYELLEAEEQRLFQLLSVFVGCTFETVEAVAGRFQRLEDAQAEVLDRLASLVDKSLLRQADQEFGGPRLLMLETIREYATERLEEDPEFAAAARRAHASYLADFTQRAWERLTGDGGEAALQELSSEVENVRIAWRFWVEHGDLEQLGKFVDGLWLLYDLRGWYHATVELATDLLEVLSSTPSTPELAEQELLLQTSLARALLAVKGYTPEVEQAYLRALGLSQAAGEVPRLFPVFRGLSSFYFFQGEFEKALHMGEQILGLAERSDDVNLRVEGHLVVGISQAFLEDLQLGLDHLEQGILAFDPKQYRASRFRLGNNPGVACFTTSAMILWWLGFPDRALERANQAVDLARKLSHPYSICYALFHTGFLHLWRREADLSLGRAQSVLELAEEHELQLWHAVGSCLHGAALAGTGQAEGGLSQIKRGLEIYQGLRTPPIFWPLLLYMLAGAYGQAGRPEQGLNVLEDAMQLPSLGYAGVTLGEFYRLKGELLMANAPDDPAQAEDWLRRALEVAEKLGAPTLELRAAVNLARLWRDYGRPEQGRQLLEAAYAKLSEGFETADLSEARSLLDGA